MEIQDPSYYNQNAQFPSQASNQMFLAEHSQSQPSQMNMGRQSNQKQHIQHSPDGKY